MGPGSVLPQFFLWYCENYTPSCTPGSTCVYNLLPSTAALGRECGDRSAESVTARRQQQQQSPVRDSWSPLITHPSAHRRDPVSGRRTLPSRLDAFISRAVSRSLQSSSWLFNKRRNVIMRRPFPLINQSVFSNFKMSEIASPLRGMERSEWWDVALGFY